MEWPSWEQINFKWWPKEWPKKMSSKELQEELDKVIKDISDQYDRFGSLEDVFIPEGTIVEVINIYDTTVHLKADIILTFIRRPYWSSGYDPMKYSPKGYSTIGKSKEAIIDKRFFNENYFSEVEQIQKGALLNKVSKIVKRKKGYYVVSDSTGKNLGGPYKTREEAKKRLRQVEFLKRKKSILVNILKVADQLDLKGNVYYARQLDSIVQKAIVKEKEQLAEEVDHVEKNYAIFENRDMEFAKLVDSYGDVWYYVLDDDAELFINTIIELADANLVMQPLDKEELDYVSKFNIKPIACFNANDQIDLAVTNEFNQYGALINNNVWPEGLFIPLKRLYVIDLNEEARKKFTEEEDVGIEDEDEKFYQKDVESGEIDEKEEDIT